MAGAAHAPSASVGGRGGVQSAGQPHWGGGEPN